MRQQLSETREQAILFAWEGQLKATNNPSLKQQCLGREAELLPQFVQHYKKFKALPHPLLKIGEGPEGRRTATKMEVLPATLVYMSLSPPHRLLRLVAG
jgi:hypothetical protein